MCACNLYGRFLQPRWKVLRYYSIPQSYAIYQTFHGLSGIKKGGNWQEPSRGKNVFYVCFLSLTQRTLFSGLNKFFFCQKASLIRGGEGPIRFVAAKKLDGRTVNK